MQRQAGNFAYFSKYLFGGMSISHLIAGSKSIKNGDINEMPKKIKNFDLLWTKSLIQLI